MHQLLEIARRQVVTLGPQQSLREAAFSMAQKNVGAIVVVNEKQEVVGMLTDRDLALALGTGRAASDTPIGEVMSKKVVTIWEDQGVFNATQYLMGNRIRRLPIVDRQNRLVGLVTSDDLLGLFARELLNVAKAFEPALGTQV